MVIMNPDEIARLKASLAADPERPPVRAAETVRALFESIHAARAKGWEWGDISKQIATEAGLDIEARTLRRTYQRECDRRGIKPNVTRLTASIDSNPSTED